jgi:hypothetical protein
MTSAQEDTQELTSAQKREASFSRALAAIIEKFEKEFHGHEAFTARRHGEAELERQRAEFERELWLLRVHLVEERPSIEYDNGDELNELISNKLAMSATIRSHGSDWWWTPASFGVQEVLQKVKRTLEKETESKSKSWRKRLGYAWSGFEELVYLALVLGIFSVATSKFETIVFAGLILIYNTSRLAVGGVGLVSLTLMYRIEENLGQVGRALKLKMPVGPANEAARQLSKTTVTVLIHSISMGVGGLIAIWHLVASILS